jgi:RNA polymerase sigma factor (TIGR02999 family)
VIDMPERRETSDITGLLSRWRLGDAAAASELAALVYGDLHRIAEREMRRERGYHTLQATGILHEAYLRIFHSEANAFNDRAHFFAVATQQLRRILLDYARKANSQKRGGGAVELSLLPHDGASVELDERLLTLNDALTRLEHLDPRAAKVVELRYFGGLTEAEAAEVLDISVATLKRDWDFAKTWLAAQLA